jgi:hypothetical protein
MSGTTVKIDDAVGRCHVDEFDEGRIYFSLGVKQASVHLILTHAEVHEIIAAFQKAMSS